MVAAGTFKDRLGFYKKISTTADELGNVYLEWQLQFTAQAEIRERTGGETVTQARLSGKNVAVIYIRKSRDSAQVTTDWKAINVRNDKEWNIRSVIEGADGAMELLAETGVAA